MGCNTSKESVQPAVEEAKEGDSVKNGGRESPKWSETDIFDVPSYIPFALVNGDSKTFGRESMCSARLLTARARGEKSASVKKSWWHRGLNDTRDGPVSRRALGRGVRIRGLRLRTSGAAGPCAAAIINGVVGAREQSVAHQTEPRVDVQVRERSRRASGDADISKAADNSVTKAEGQEGAEDDKEKAAAATKIQAAFRGHHARKSLRVPETASKETRAGEPSESTQEQLQKEFPIDDQELSNAATKIQATFRGHMSRKEQATATAKSAMNMVESATAKIEEKMQDAVNELEGIDLADPDLHKAATKIQASFRGHKVRQEVNIHTTADDIKK